MATFPAIAPIHAAPKRTAPLSSTLMLGDGYEVSIRFGLNSARAEWQLTWETNETNSDTIENFLQLRADSGEYFDWQPPDSTYALQWRCDEWTVEYISYNWRRVNASFRQVFEQSLSPSIIPTLASCPNDVLCSLDLGEEGLAPCIAVIDETSPGIEVQTADWNAFRAAWPSRPFTVLVPGDVNSVILPTGFDGVRLAVNRDNGNIASASDWFTLAQLSLYAPGQPVFLFVDNSGSMTTATVQASLNLFNATCLTFGLPVYSVTNGAERYIEPFISALVPP